MSTKPKPTRKKVLCPMERQGKTYWMRIGSAFTNVDGSTNVYLDAFPANGKLHIRDVDERDERKHGSGNSIATNYSEHPPLQPNATLPL